MSDYFEKGNLKLHRMDCMELMKSKPDNYYDLAITDPEYGGNDAIGINNNNGNNKQAALRTEYKVFKNIAPEKEYFEELKRVSKHQIIWGVNFYNNFDLSGGRIVWDKKGTAFGRAEMAYYSNSKSVQIFEYAWNGMIQGDMKNKEVRIHVTQKPVALYKWILKNYAKPGDKILDTHGGSFSSAIAAYYFDCEFEGTELDEDYFADSIKRVEQQTNQLKLL